MNRTEPKIRIRAANRTIRLTLHAHQEMMEENIAMENISGRVAKSV